MIRVRHRGCSNVLPSRASLAGNISASPISSVLSTQVRWIRWPFSSSRAASGCALATAYKDAGAYVRSHAIQALAIELAEAYAEKLHQDLRAWWGFPIHRDDHA